VVRTKNISGEKTDEKTKQAVICPLWKGFYLEEEVSVKQISPSIFNGGADLLGEFKSQTSV